MGTAERKEKEKAQRREDILNTAKKIFLEKGFRGTTIEAIAEECELSTGTIYLYFKNKDDLYSAINILPLDFLDREMTKIVEDDSLSVEEKLRMAWTALYNSFASDPVSLRAILHFQLEDSLKILSPDRLNRLNRASQSFMGKIASIFKTGIEAGLFRPANINAYADLFWGAFSGTILWEEAKTKADPQKDFLESTLDLGLEVLLKGISQK